MNSSYKDYLSYLGKAAHADAIACHAEHSMLPVFLDLKRLINHYSDVIAKFDTVQSELTEFVSSFEFDVEDIDEFYNLFQGLKNLDCRLNTLISDADRLGVSREAKKFVKTAYSSTSLGTVDEVAIQANKFHTEAVERSIRSNEINAIAMKVIIAIIGVAIIALILLGD